MQKSRLVMWVEIAATLSVLVGLLLVFLELRQSNQHATADATREIYQEWSEIYRHESEYQIDLLIAKAISQPHELTDAELYRLDDYYTMVMNAYFVRAMMQRSGLLAMNDILEEAQFIVEEFFNYPVAREWFEMVNPWIKLRAPDLHRALVSAAGMTPVNDSAIWIEDWRARFSPD